MVRLLAFSLIVLVFSCSPKDTVEPDNEANKQDGEEQVFSESTIHHSVFLKVKAGANLDSFVSIVSQMEEIPGVQNFEVGRFKELGDERALNVYSWYMYMSFVDSLNYEAYQNHPLHLELKNKTRHMMSGPPASYDYIRVY